MKYKYATGCKSRCGCCGKRTYEQDVEIQHESTCTAAPKTDADLDLVQVIAKSEILKALMLLSNRFPQYFFCLKSDVQVSKLEVVNLQK